MSKPTILKRKAAPTNRGKKLPRFKTIVPELFSVYEITDISDVRGKRCRVKFQARYEPHALLYSAFGLSRSEQKQTLYIKFENETPSDTTLNDLAEKISTWTEQAYAAVEHEVVPSLFSKNAKPQLIISGGASDFGTIMERVCFPGKFTKYFTKNFLDPVKEAKVKHLEDDTGNSLFFTLFALTTLDITAENDAVVASPFLNIDSLTWINKGQDTKVAKDLSLMAKADYMLKLDGLIGAVEHKAKVFPKETKMDYSTEDSEHPEDVLPPQARPKAPAAPKKGRGGAGKRGRGRPSGKRKLEVEVQDVEAEEAET